MLLQLIETDPARYQFRARPFSEATVAGIVAEGIDLSKFDVLPVHRSAGLRYVVAGDGHSRLEAIRRLAEAKRLPSRWKIRDGYDIPCRVVSPEEARILSWTANLSRDGFTAGEEARVYQSMVDAGRTVADVARLAHKSATHVQSMLTLNNLCRDILDAVGGPPAAGGIDVLTGQVLAAGFKRHGVAPQQQQELWHRCLKHAMLNFQSSKKFIDAIGPRLAERSSEGMLFELPADVMVVVNEARARGQAARSAKMGLALLLKAGQAGGLAGVPDLSRWLDDHGARTLARLSDMVTEDADVLSTAVLFA